MIFQIGQKVKIRKYEDLPRTMQTPHVAKLAGRVGLVYDCLYRARIGKTIYYITFEGQERASAIAFEKAALEEFKEPKVQYDFRVEVEGNRVFATLYKTFEHGTCQELGSGYGFVKQDNDQSIAQAASWAFNEIQRKLIKCDEKDWTVNTNIKE